MKLIRLIPQSPFFCLLTIFLLQSLAATSQTFHVSKADISVTGTAREKSWSMKTNTAQGSANLLFKDGKLAQVRSLNLSIPVGELKSDNPRMDARAYKGLKMYPYDRIRFAGKTMKLSGSGTGSYRLFTEGNLQIAGITQVAILLVDIQVNNDGTLTGRGTTEIKRSDFDIRLLAAEEAVMSLSDVIRVDFQLTLSRIGN